MRRDPSRGSGRRRAVWRARAADRFGRMRPRVAGERSIAMKGMPVQTLRAVALYAGLTAAFLGAADLLYARRYFPRLQPISAGTTVLVNRMAWYETHRDDYDLIFFGDSRTFCGIH